MMTMPTAAQITRIVRRPLNIDDLLVPTAHGVTDWPTWDLFKDYPG